MRTHQRRLLPVLVAVNSVGVVVLAGLVVIAFQLNADRVTQINAERARNTLTACEGQNARHDDTIRTFDRLIADMPPGPRKRRAVQGRESTVFLLEAIVPHRDCAALVRAQVHP